MPVELPLRIREHIDAFAGRAWLLPQLQTWLQQQDERVFLITGLPGAGKSMLAAWLAGFGPVPADPAAAAQLCQLRATIRGAHFCIAGASVAPQDVIGGLARRLTETLPDYGQALLASNGREVQITITQHAGNVSGSMTGVAVERLVIGDITPERATSLLLVDPLHQLYAAGYDTQIVLLVDALDEAETASAGPKVAQLLGGLRNSPHLPRQVRILATTRPDPRVLAYFKPLLRESSLDLIGDAPAAADDMAQYAQERLAGLDADRRAVLAQKVATAAKGIFLYAHLVLEDLRAHPPASAEIETLELPRDLSDLYLQFLLREIGAEERWYNIYYPVLGLIAVAQGDGLSRTQIQSILGKPRPEVELALRACAQYLAGSVPDGPFRPFHQSFAEFLLDDEHNTDRHIDATEMHSYITDYYLDGATSWDSVDWTKTDDYGLRYLAHHLSGGGKREELYRLLAASPAWMQAKRGALHGDTSYVADVNLAMTGLKGAETTTELLHLVQLATVRQVVQQWGGLYTNTALKMLVWLKRDAEAVNHARLRLNPSEKYMALRIIYDVQRQHNRGEDGLLVEAMTAARSIEPTDERVKALSAVAAALAQVGRGEEASQMYTEALQLAQGIKPVAERCEALSAVAVALVQVGQSEESLAVARGIEFTGWRVKVLSDMAVALAQAGRREEASRICTEARQVAQGSEPASLDPIVLSAMAVALAQAGQREEASRICTEARQVAQGFEPASVRTVMLRPVAVALVQVGRSEEALAIARDLESTDVYTLCAVAVALAQAGHIEPAHAAARIIEDFNEFSFKGLGKKSQYTEALCAVAVALAQARREQDALAVARGIEGADERAEALCAVAVALAQAGRQEEASRICTEALALAEAQNLEDAGEYAETLSAVAAALAQAGRGEEASQICTEALQVARGFEDASRRAQELSAVAAALAQAGRGEEASQICTEALQVAQHLWDDLLRHAALSAVAVALAQAGQSEEALAVAQGIEDASQHTQTLSEMSAALAQAGRGEEASRICAEALQLAQNIEDASARARALSVVAAALAQTGQGEEAHRRCTEALQIAQNIGNAGVRARALSAVAAALAQTGQGEEAHRRCTEALQIAQGIRDDPLGPIVLNAVATALAQAGQSEEALAVAQSIENTDEHAEALSAVAVVLAQAQEIELAQEAARTIEDADLYAEASSAVAVALVQTGKFYEAFLALQPLNLHNYCRAIAQWLPSLEKRETAFSLAVGGEVARIMGWVWPQWHKIYAIMAPSK